MPTPLKSLFSSFWGAIDGRALSGLDRAEASLAFLSSLLECTVFLSRRVLNDPTASVLLDGSRSETVQAMTAQQIARVWEEASTNNLKLDSGKASEELARTLVVLYKTDQGMSPLNVKNA